MLTRHSYAVYAAISALSILIMLNITPFAHRMHSGLTWLVMTVFVISLIYSWTAFPFTRGAPLKVFFQQRVDLELPTESSPHGSVVRAETFLTAPEGFVDNSIIPLLPSSYEKNISCDTDTKLRKGLRTCKWDTMSLLPSPGGATALDLAPASLISASKATRASDWLSAKITRSAGKNATIAVRGVNTRVCHLTFDSPISAF